jgi:hypothetical protein
MQFAGLPTGTNSLYSGDIVPAYDWVAFSWLFGSMDELPFHYPQLWGRPLLGRGGLKVVEKFRKFSMPSGVGISMACLMS